MGTIIYKPHCAKCGSIINDEVTYRRLEMKIAKNYLYSGGCIEIEPNRCESCGDWFETIEVPMPKESENWVNFAEDLMPIMNEAESEVSE